MLGNLEPKAVNKPYKLQQNSYPSYNKGKGNHESNLPPDGKNTSFIQSPQSTKTVNYQMKGMGLNTTVGNIGANYIRKIWTVIKMI